MTVTGCMKCYSFEESRLAKWNDEFYIYQHKLNGDRGRAILDPRLGVHLLSSEANDRNFALPAIREQLQSAMPLFHSAGIYEPDGEFYCHGMEHEDIHSICSRSTNLHPNHEAIQFHMFDHIVPNITCFDRITELNRLKLKINDNYPNLRIVDSFIVTNLEQIMVRFHHSIQLNYEGMILRRVNGLYISARSTDIMKFKPSQEDTYDIVGFSEEISIEGNPKGRIGAIICRKEGQDFSVSAGLNDDSRDRLWRMRETLAGKRCKINYQAVTKYGTPKFCTDLEVLS